MLSTKESPKVKLKKKDEINEWKNTYYRDINQKKPAVVIKQTNKKTHKIDFKKKTQGIQTDTI